jgi:hypothetical protein
MSATSGAAVSQRDPVLADARQFVATTIGTHPGMPMPLLLDLARQSRRHLIALFDALG